MLNKRKSISEFKQKSSFKEYETILLGDANVGKTTYMTKLIQQQCKSNTPQSISDDQNLFEFLFEFNDNKAIFILKDTANQEKFRSLTQSYYRKAPCVLLMFDLYNQESFDHLQNWYRDIETYSSQRKHVAVVLVGLVGKHSTDSSSNKVNSYFIDAFKEEHDEILGYIEINLNDDSCNLKEPFEILIDFLARQPLNGRQSIINLNGRYSSMNRYNLSNEVIDEESTELINEKSCCTLS